jgi:AAA+ ATPase superfamily predicted ATPase
MSQQKFVDRKEELGFLEERYKTDLAEFVVLYGRRRVGKSKHVEWNNGKRKEHFAIFAKKIEGKDAIRKSGFLVWDMEVY